MSGATRGLLALSVFLAANLGLTACSDDGSGITAVDRTSSSGLEVASSVPLTQPEDVEPDASLEYYESLGLTTQQGQCLLKSALRGPFAVEYSEDGSHSMTLSSGEGEELAVPWSVTSNVELERLLIDHYASDCLSDPDRAKLAQESGAAEDGDTIDVAIPELIARRSAHGATAQETECLRGAFTTAPVRLGSIIEWPRVIEEQCIEPTRLLDLEAAPIAAGLTATGADATAAACIAHDRNLRGDLEDLMVEMETSGDVAQADVAIDPGACVDREALTQIAFAAAVAKADFGGEPLR
jgi:hypothetical protein